MSPDTASQLLLGLVALQSGLIDQTKLVAAFQAWTVDRSKSLTDHLVALGHLDDTRRTLIESLARAHLDDRGGDTEKSLAELTLSRSTLAQLQSLADDDLDATLSHVGKAAPFPSPDRTDFDPVGDGSSPRPRFRRIRHHASGGLGDVFVATDSELNREVALKQIREIHADNPRLRSRFLVEAQFTGGLEHPGIVPIYSLGTDPNDRPYYAMRFVGGETLRGAIARYHQGSSTDPRRTLEFRQLLKRFTDICNTVDYAHSRGVIHRDIKPDNVIVGNHGETLVVDWGIARALGSTGSETTGPPLIPQSDDDASGTLPGQIMGTPAYMSPEQARGDLDRLGPQSDVYSLGATLYCLITGKAPFQGHSAAILKAVELGVFPTPRLIDPAIDPALEAIVLKAMANDPRARYGSAKALAEDLEQWLADERVDAYREPWTRSLNRWLTRHRTTVTGLVAAGLVALIGLGIVSAVQIRARKALDASNAKLTEANNNLSESNAALDIQRQRAEANESQAIDAVKRFKDAVLENPELRKNPALEPLRKTLLREPLAYFGKLRDRLEADESTTPESLDRLANVAFEHAYLVNVVGGKQDALAAYQHSVGILERLAGSHPEVARFQAHLANSHHNLALLYRDLGRTDEALSAFQEGRKLRDQLVQNHPEVTEYLADLSDSHNDLGNLLQNQGRNDEALEAYSQAQSIQERLIAADPESRFSQGRLATIHNNIGNLLREQGRGDEALKQYEQAREVQERLVQAESATNADWNDLAVSMNNIGNLLRDRGRVDEALKAYDRAREIQEKLVRDHPDVALYPAYLAGSLNNIGVILGARGRVDEALKAYERAREIQEKLVRDHPDVVSYRAQLAMSSFNYARLLAGKGRPDEAIRIFEQTREILDRLVRDQPKVQLYQSQLSACHNAMGILQLDQGRVDEALEAYARAQEIREQLARANPEVPEFRADLSASYNNRGLIYFSQNRAEPALEAFEQARAIQEQLTREAPDVARYAEFLATSHTNIGLVFQQMGRPDDAMAAFQQARDLRDRLARDHPQLPEYASALGNTWDRMASIDLAASRPAEALAKIEEADRWLRIALAANPRFTRYRQWFEMHLTSRIQAERGLGHDEQASQVERELAQFRLQDPRFEAVDARLKAVRDGEALKDNTERMILAQRATDIRQFRTAVKLWGEAFDADPKLADSRQPQHRYNAACAAVLAADGQGVDPAPDEAEKGRLRGLALGWLEAERAAWAGIVESESSPKAARAQVAKVLRHWQGDADLASVRDSERLDEAERAGWKTLWEGVAALLRQVE